MINPREEDLLTKARELLEKELPLRIDHEIRTAPELKGFQFLSAKPILYVYNVSESDIGRFRGLNEQKEPYKKKNRGMCKIGKGT